MFFIVCFFIYKSCLLLAALDSVFLCFPAVRLFTGSFIHPDKSGTVVPLDENKQQISDKIQESEYHTAGSRPILHTVQSCRTEQTVDQLCYTGFIQQIPEIIPAESTRKLLALHVFFHNPAHIRNPVHPFSDADFMIDSAVIFPIVCGKRETVVLYPVFRNYPPDGKGKDADDHQIQKAVKPCHVVFSKKRYRDICDENSIPLYSKLKLNFSGFPDFLRKQIRRIKEVTTNSISKEKFLLPPIYEISAELPLLLRILCIGSLRGMNRIGCYTADCFSVNLQRCRTVKFHPYVVSFQNGYVFGVPDMFPFEKGQKDHQRAELSCAMEDKQRYFSVLAQSVLSRCGHHSAAVVSAVHRRGKPDFFVCILFSIHGYNSIPRLEVKQQSLYCNRGIVDGLRVGGFSVLFP